MELVHPLAKNRGRGHNDHGPVQLAAVMQSCNEGNDLDYAMVSELNLAGKHLH